MNSKERFHAVTHYQPYDRLFRWEMGRYEETRKRWQSEGMPTDKSLGQIVGYDGFGVIPFVLRQCPGFEKKVIEETDEYQIYQCDRDGAIKKIRKDTPPPAMPQYIRFPVETREDWERFRKERLDPDNPSRFPRSIAELKEQYGNLDRPVGITAGSMFGWLRDWIGVENFSMMFYDDPKLVHEMMDYLGDYFVEMLKKVVFEMRFDYAQLWEDMAYKNGSLISPKLVREFMVPGYRKVVDLLHKADIDIILLDSDGDVEELIPIWIECGINFIYPFEVAAGMDVVQLRKKFGKDLLMGGGMDKRVMAGDKASIKAMVEEKRDLILEGGYIPGCDHAIPPDIPWENFLYYRELLHDIA